MKRKGREGAEGVREKEGRHELWILAMDGLCAMVEGFGLWVWVLDMGYGGSEE